MTKKKILIVDDELIGRQLIQAILMVGGYEPILAANGFEAISMATEYKPDLILLDIMMPNMNGFEVTKRIRQDNQLKHIPILMVSALDDRNSKMSGLNAGANDYIAKPFEKIDILSKIRKLLSNSI